MEQETGPEYSLIDFHAPTLGVSVLTVFVGLIILLCCGVCIHSCCCGGKILQKCFGCLTGCCSSSTCCDKAEEPLEVSDDKDIEDIISPCHASNPSGWRHQGTLATAFDSGSTLSSIYTVPVSQSVTPTQKQITAVSSFPGTALMTSTRSPAVKSSRPLPVRPRTLEGGMIHSGQRKAATTTSKFNTVAATLPRNYTNATSRPLYVINQHGHLLPHDPDFTTVNFRQDGAVHYRPANPAQGRFEDHEEDGEVNQANHYAEAREPPKAPPPSRAASLAALSPSALEAAGFGVKPLH